MASLVRPTDKNKMVADQSVHLFQILVKTKDHVTKQTSAEAKDYFALL